MCVAQELTPEVIDKPPEADLVIAEFVVNQESVLVGEPIELKLIVEVPEGIILVEYPSFTDSIWGSFMLVSTEEVKTQSTNNENIYQQSLNLRLWETGDFETPDTFIGYQLENDTKIYRIPVKKLHFQVLSVLETTDLNALTIHPSRNPIYFFYISPWIIGVSGLIVLLISWRGHKIYKAYRYKHQSSEQFQVKTPSEITLEILERIKYLELTPIETYLYTSNALRTYLSAVLQTSTTEMTTLEIVEHIMLIPLFDAETPKKLQFILEQIDLIKFAPTEASEKSAMRLVTIVYRWVANISSQVEKKAIPGEVTSE